MRMRFKLFSTGWLNALGLFFSWWMINPATASTDHWQMNMYKGVTPISHAMYDLHMLAIAVCAAIGLLVFGVMFYAMIYHRKSKGYPAAQFHTNTRLEFLWTVLPFFILIGLAFPATKTLIKMEDSSKADVTIKVVGYQWKWQYQYLDQGLSFFSQLSTPYSQIRNEAPKGKWYLLEVDKPVVVPINKKIRFLVTSNDVIHSWWVPELGIKRDAIPGFMHEAWARIQRPGTYRGQCTELCGINHGFMPIVVKAVSQDKFNAWVVAEAAREAAVNQSASSRTMSREELMDLGKTRYDAVCSACHQQNGMGIPPMFPALKGSSIAIGRPIDRHIRLILNGVAGTAMQSYKDALTDEEIAAIITYERNAWENNTNDQVQPADVIAVRNAQITAPTIVKKAQAGGLQ